MMKFREQADKYDVPVVDDKVATLTRIGHSFEATTSEGKTYHAPTVILAVGRERRKLHLEHEDEWTGRGVSFCSTCDAPLHRDNIVAVVGGGNAAVRRGSAARQVRQAGVHHLPGRQIYPARAG